MKSELKKDLLLSCLLQVVILIVLFFGWKLGLMIGKAGVYVSFGIYILSLIFLFAYGEKSPYIVHLVTIITSLATGMLIGSFISQYSKDITLVMKILAGFAGLVLLIHGSLLLIPFRKIILGLMILLLLFVIIYGFTKFNDITYKEITLLSINFFFTLIGMFVYLVSENDIGTCLAGSLLWAFIVIFIVIIIVLSEGDALSGLDGVDLGGSRKGRKRK